MWDQRTYLSAGSLPKKATKVKKEIIRMTMATFRRVPIVSLNGSQSSVKAKQLTVISSHTQDHTGHYSIFLSEDESLVRVTRRLISR
jgi:hypothetical protein